MALSTQRNTATALAVALLAAACPLAWPSACRAVETIAFVDDDGRQTVEGRALVRDSVGGALLQSDDGALWLITGDSVVSSRSDARSFAPVSDDELKRRLLATLPTGFQVYSTPHYLVAYNTSRDFAKWTASMLERLQRAFVNYWSRQGFDLHEPEFPLVVTIYADRASYRRAAQRDLGNATGVVGYYSLRTNRVTMFDLTGAEEARGGGGRRSSLKEINQILATPAALPLVATVVHEATHQIAFNCGLQQRFADLPLWLVEGMAVYFEAPDLSSSRGWRGIGKINYLRLETFRKNLGAWRESSLRTLIADSRRFRDPRTAVDAYADAWALNYFLIKYRSKQYNAYLRAMAEKPPLGDSTADERVAEFEEHFGDLGELQRDFLRQMSRLR